MVLPGDHPPLGAELASEIPYAKKPKVRPPRDLRDKAIFPERSLPTYTGPYHVATMEIEVPAKHPQVFSHITRHGRHMLQLETVLMTVYYPADYDAYHSVHHGSLSRELWLGRPRFSMAHGYGDFVGLGRLAVPIFLPTMFTKLPAYRNAPVAKHWAPSIDTKHAGPQVKSKNGAKPEGADDEPTFPLLMFSHGLGGTRTMYSSQCGEFASHGFVVCAVEHRDGSGPCTYVLHPTTGEGSIVDVEIRGGVDHKPKEHKRGYDVVDYIWPKDNRFDTMPNNKKGVDMELRGAQLALRMAEIEEAYYVMCEIANGNGKHVEHRNLRCKGAKASSSHGLEDVDWARWKNRFHLHHVSACGHSFGAATTVEMLRHPDRFKYISQGIIYDIWGAGTKPPEEDAPNHRIKAPLLAINSEAFTYWPSNFNLVASLVDEAHDNPHPCPSWLMTLRGTVHVSQSDFSILYPTLTSFLLKAMADPQRALDLNINASLEFLSKVLPAELAQVNRAYQNEGLLEVDVHPLEYIPTQDKHKPNEKFIAMRLKIRHEWLYRINPKFFRKLRRREAKRSGELHEIGNEIWLHVRPTPEVLELHQVQTGSKLSLPTESHGGASVTSLDDKGEHDASEKRQAG